MEFPEDYDPQDVLPEIFDDFDLDENLEGINMYRLGANFDIDIEDIRNTDSSDSSNEDEVIFIPREEPISTRTRRRASQSSSAEAAPAPMPVASPPPPPPPIMMPANNSQHSNQIIAVDDGEENNTPVNNQNNNNNIMQPGCSQGPKSPTTGNDEGDDCCVICTEKLTSDKDHQISTLKCGHIFGYSCLHKWLEPKQRRLRCPTCNNPAKRRDIVRIYAQRILAYDKGKLDEYKTRWRSEVTNSNALLEKNKKLMDELETLKKSLIKHNTAASTARVPLNLCDKNGQSAKFFLSFLKTVQLRDEGWRHQEYCRIVGALVVSISKPTANRSANASRLNMPQHGVSLIYLGEDGTRQETILMHRTMMESMVIDQGRGELISISRDRTLKVTSLMNKKEVASLTNAPWPMTSLMYSKEQPNELFIGTSTGDVVVLDRRQLGPVPLYEFETLSKKPITRMCNIECKPSKDSDGVNGDLLKGLMLTSMDSAMYLPKAYSAASTSNMTTLPFNGFFATCEYEPQSGLTLLSTRTNNAQSGKHYVS